MTSFWRASQALARGRVGEQWAGWPARRDQQDGAAGSTWRRERWGSPSSVDRSWGRGGVGGRWGGVVGDSAGVVLP
jgi:hypothetical protein